MIPGEIITASDPIAINVGRPTVIIKVANSGDRPIQVGSHYRFFETNPALIFDRAAACGMHLAIAAGTAPFAGAFRPDGALAALAGSPSEGNWTLKINDGANGDGRGRRRPTGAIPTRTRSSTGINAPTPSTASCIVRRRSIRS